VNITEPLRRAAIVAPDAVAIIRADGTPLTYAALERLIDRMAQRVAGLGLRPGDVVGLAITGPDESLGLILAFALARLGIASADPSLPAARMRWCFKLGAAAAPGIVGFDASWLAAPAAAQAVAIHPDPAATLRIFASSGTTGVPKHAAVSHELMTRRVLSGLLALEGGPATRIVAVNLGITLGLSAVLRTLWLGGTLVLSNPAEALAAIEAHGVTSLLVSPVALRAVLQAMSPLAPPPPTLRTVEVSGSKLPAPLYQQAAARLCRNILSWLGATETSGIAAGPMAALAARPGAVGYVLAGVEVQAVDAANAPLPAGQEGVLRVRGANNVVGYVGEAGAESFRDGWFYPGDIGTVWPDGMLSLAGRTHEVINSGGVKLSPHVIEEALLTLPLVTDAAAFGVPDAAGIEQPWAAIVAAAPIDNAVLTAFCQKVLPGRAPKVILQMQALPRNASGKVQRDLLVAYAVQVSRPRTPPG